MKTENISFLVLSMLDSLRCAISAIFLKRESTYEKEFRKVSFKFNFKIDLKIDNKS